MTVEESAAARLGFWSSLCAGITTLLAFGIAVVTPPLSGPWCRTDCIGYPYFEIADRFPRDYFWMFPAIVATLCFVAMTVAVYESASAKGRPLAAVGLLLAVMAAVTLVGDYVLQLAVIQPSVLAGDTDGVSLLTQYNPHGLFIALEEMGYMLMSMSLACLAPAISRATRCERLVRRVVVGGLAVNLIALIAILLRYGHRREYRFEIAVISVDWMVLIIAALGLAVVFRRRLSARSHGSRPLSGFEV
jgi:hypothetical protein